jgi:hypothetical protein
MRSLLAVALIRTRIECVKASAVRGVKVKAYAVKS